LAHLEHEPGQLETIVVDGGSSDGTAEAAARFPRVRWIDGPRGRGQQMNAGARAARGDVLLFLHSDTHPPRGSVAELPSLLASRDADFGAFRIRFDPPVWLPSLLAVMTRFPNSWYCFGDQGFFSRKDFFFSTGGFPEIAILEDVHWIRAAARRGRMVRSPHAVISSARRFEQIGTVRQSLRNLSILVRDLLGESPDQLAARYARGYRQQSRPDVKARPIANPAGRPERETIS
jgi:rSAM/selenodomain-associated transferase 2